MELCPLLTRGKTTRISLLLGLDACISSSGLWNIGEVLEKSGEVRGGQILPALGVPLQNRMVGMY